MQTKKNKAVKNDEELSKLESELMAKPEEEEEELEDQSKDETVEEESAPSEEQTAEEEESESEEPASESEEEDLTEEEKERLSEKTRREMSQLREKARKSEELEKELESLKKQKEVRKPLEEAKEQYLEEEETPEYRLPWQQATPTSEQMRKLAREEVDRERRVSLIGTDADELETKYPELNPNSEEYNGDLVSDIYSTFKAEFSRDDSIRLKDIAQRKLNIINKIREKAKAEKETEEKIEKQDAEQAPPVQVSPRKKKTSVSDMINRAGSIDELEKLESKIK